MNRILLIFMTMVFLLSGCAKYRLDTQVRELCAKDGGIRVYETVKLAPEKFDKYGNINFFRATQGENALGPEYIFVSDYDYYYKSQETWYSNALSMYRSHIKIIRKADMELLGERISYHRGGGDWPGPWHPSSFRCPPMEEMLPGLESFIFIKENKL